MKQGDKNIWAHLSMLTACIFWGLMSPMGKDAMEHGINGLNMVTFRALGAALCFWIASFFIRETKEISPKHMLKFFFASLLAIVFNQCCFTIGLSITSPVNASIVTTMMPIVTMVLAAVILKEPVTKKKVMGLFSGAIGALLLILGSQSSASGKASSIWGDLLCLTAQCSFALYLTLFRGFIQQYHVITCMKWMFTFSSLVILPFSYTELTQLPWNEIDTITWMETVFVVVCSTFIAYILMMYGQKSLRPTVVSMYNYAQPIVACLVSVMLGLGVFGWLQGIAVILVFSGVWMVTQSKNRKELMRSQTEGPTKTLET